LHDDNYSNKSNNEISFHWEMNEKKNPFIPIFSGAIGKKKGLFNFLGILSCINTKKY